MPAGITQERLLALLADLIEHEPHGVRLLRQMHAPKEGEVFPSDEVSRETFVAASEQAMAEHRDIREMTRRLRRLTPVITNMSLADY